MAGRPIEPIRIDFMARYPAKWLSVKGPGCLSLEAFGAWNKIVDLMWVEGDGAGMLEGTPAQLSRMIGADSIEQMERIVDEMESAGIGHISRDGNRVRFESPKMRREWETSFTKIKKKRTRDRKYQEEKTAQKEQKRIIVSENESKIEREVGESSYSLSMSDSNKEEKVSAVSVFIARTGWIPPGHYQDMIEKSVHSLSVWDAVVCAWMEEGWKKTSVAKMLDRYKRERSSGSGAARAARKKCHRCKENEAVPPFRVCLRCKDAIDESLSPKSNTSARKDEYSPPE